jgi:hypothetical protein
MNMNDLPVCLRKIAMEEEVLQRLFYVSSTKHTIIALEKHVLSSKKGSSTQPVL